MNKKDCVLFGMNNSTKLATKVSELLQLPLSKVERTVYADGETMLVPGETVRNRDVFVIASTSRPVNENVIELLLFIDALKRASAKSINIILSYYGYARQDRKASGRQPIGAKLMADLLQTAGATKITCVDLHNPSIQGFFDIPVDDLKGQYPIAIALKDMKEKFTVVSPDHGGTVRARKLAELIADTVQICIIDKRRTDVNKTEVMGILGNIENKNAVIIDDIIDTGGTILKAVDTLKENGAKKVVVAATHGIFTKGFEMFENNPNVEKVIITDSIDNYELASRFTKLEIISLSEFLSKVIKASFEDESISQIYQDYRTLISKM
ncbi:ribose-phosphate pyrophosphokinase [Mycoplasma sp. CSL10137]|uniref:ribose-phosphate pyrophosphokinase n=1 Tax=unclassified Mycoplasma TaxID=2683645 RepID=UPI00197BA238|nr:MULTISPECIES: ribose-phosphate pyrophosphokinase [unclassified Mycoplasma]MBN4083643.1 ribose-phosphate pyrophosphokinase [Mycoplasma sp. CSL10137]MBN4084072.1 ribose-phosphate pyrophosphokinase [Mycoplasma sp. CSL10166]MBU4693271.1 ribose-phosphate pyrophosphokinase [Mycoplasma sp. CSL7491-lung]